MFIRSRVPAAGTVRAARRPHRRTLRAAAAACIALLATWPALATIPVAKDFEDLVLGSDGVVVGHVAAVESSRDEDGAIYTFVTLDELEVVDGAFSGAELVLQLEGGEVEGEGLWIHGRPEFREGERVLVFVKDNGYSTVPLAGWTQGVFRVPEDADSGRRVVHDHAGNKVFGVTGRARGPASGGAVHPSSPLRSGRRSRSRTSRRARSGAKAIRWNGVRANMYISTTSIPIGSSWDRALRNAMWHWNNVRSSYFTYYVGRNTDGRHSSSNSRNEVYRAPIADPDTLAVTRTRTFDRRLGTSFGIDLSTGVTGTLGRWVYIPTNTQPGTYYLGFMIDPEGRLADMNESNDAQPMPQVIRIF